MQGNNPEIFTVTERIEELRNFYTLNKAKFCEKLRYNPKNYDNHTSADEPTRPSAELIQAVALRTKVNVVWLLTGEGPMMIGGIREPVPEGIINIPRMELGVSAGADGMTASEETQEGEWPFPEPYYRRMIGHDPSQVVMVNVIGDSMVPTLAPNDVVAVLVADSQKPSDGLWVVRFGEEVYVKRIQRVSGTTLAVISDNPAYRALEVDFSEEQSDFALVGRVVWAPKQY